jgi:hypothetical protein
MNLQRITKPCQGLLTERVYERIHSKNKVFYRTSKVPHFRPECY